MSYPLWLDGGVNTIQKLFHRPARQLCALVSQLWPAPASETPPPAIDYDRLTVDGLPLRDAIAVRSAEFWLALGEPHLALREFDTLTDLARQHAWCQRVHAHALEEAGATAR